MNVAQSFFGMTCPLLGYFLSAYPISYNDSTETYLLLPDLSHRSLTAFIYGSNPLIKMSL